MFINKPYTKAHSSAKYDLLRLDLKNTSIPVETIVIKTFKNGEKDTK